MAIMITKANFEDEVLKSDKPVLLDFWASWCNPCRMISPMINEIADEMPQIKVGKINVDDQEELASQFSIESIPTLILLKDGKVVKTNIGALPKEEIRSFILEQ